MSSTARPITPFDQLAEGDTIYETFTIYVRDEHNAWTAKTVTVAIHGTNDIPTLNITGSDWNITQGGDLSIDGTFTVTDNDRDAGTGQTFHIAGGKDTSGTGTDGAHGTDGDTNATFTTDYGTLTLDPATGQWTYEANPDAIKGLGKDETKIETFEVAVTDEARRDLHEGDHRCPARHQRCAVDQADFHRTEGTGGL